MAIRPESLMLGPKRTALEADSTEQSASERLRNYFASHEKTELNFLNDYKATVEDCPDETINFLLQLIIADEETHYRIVQSMVSALDASLQWNTPPDEMTGLGKMSEDERRKLLRLTESYIVEEKLVLRPRDI